MRILYFFFLVLLTSPLLGQTSFSFSQRSIQDTLAGSITETFVIDITNLTGNDLDLSWTTVTRNIPVGWDRGLCDYGTCYSNIPTSSQMATVTTDTNGFFQLHLNPYNIPGTADVSFYVYDVNFPNDGDTCFFEIFFPGYLGVSISELSSSTNLYPNPASDIVNINSSFADLKVSMVNLLGEELESFIINAGTTKQVSVADYPSGYYFLRFTDQAGQTFSQKLVVK